MDHSAIYADEEKDIIRAVKTGLLNYCRMWMYLIVGVHIICIRWDKVFVLVIHEI